MIAVCPRTGARHSPYQTKTWCFTLMREETNSTKWGLGSYGLQMFRNQNTV